MTTTPTYKSRLIHTLVREVDDVFGVEARCAANDRAYDTAAYLKDADSGEWLRVFTDAFEDELRRLLRPH